MPAYITFMTDFGLRDDSVGCCHGVILGRAPAALLIDLTHDIPAFDVRRGALTWRNVLPYMPMGVHIGVVDPGVGTARRALALLTARGDVLIGPDNGLLPEGAAALGGATKAVELTNPSYILQPRSATFHGRDIFSPMAAALTTGVALDTLGPAVPLENLVTLASTPPRWDGDVLHATVSYVDRFGNLRLDAGLEAVERWGVREGDLLSLTVGGAHIVVPFALSFGSAAVGEAAVIVDAYRLLMVAVNQGDAAALYGATTEMSVVLRRAEAPKTR